MSALPGCSGEREIAMSVNVELSSAFGVFTDNVLKTSIEGQTVREVLHSLTQKFPKLGRVLLNKDGDLMQTYDFFINGQSVYPKSMTTPLNSGDLLNILYLIHGG
jgi:molybdopterin synthase sulfur carrier subunit